MLRRVRRRKPAAPPPVRPTTNPNPLSPPLLPSPTPLSSLLPPSLNPSKTAVDLILRRLNRHTSPPLSPSESHLLPHVGPTEISKIILLTQSDPLSSLRFFNWARSVLNPNCIPPKTFILLADILLKSNLFSSAMRVLSDLVLSTDFEHFDDLCDCHPAIFGMLLKVYSKHDKIRQGIVLFDKIVFLGLPITADDVNSLLNALCKANFYDQCWKIYGKMKNSGAIPNCYTFNILTGVLCKSGDVDKFEGFMGEMEILGFEPDVVTYNTLINGFCKRERIGEAMNLYRIMSVRGVEPDLITYTTLIIALGREEKSQDASKLFDEMRKRGIVPDNRAYNALIYCFCEEGGIEKGRNLLKEMIQSGLKPDKFTCDALFEGYKKREKVVSFLSLLVELRKHGGERIVSYMIYKTLIDVLCRERKPNAARSLIKLFSDDGYKLNLEIFNQMIQSFYECDLLDECFQMKDEMMDHGLEPDWTTYASLGKCLCKKGKMEAAETMMREMGSSGVSLNSEICMAIVEGYCEEREYGEAERVMREMAEEFGVFDVKGFNAIINGYAAQGDVRKSIEMQERMIRLGIMPNAHTCSLMIRGLAKELELKGRNV